MTEHDACCSDLSRQDSLSNLFVDSILFRILAIVRILSPNLSQTLSKSGNLAATKIVENGLTDHDLSLAEYYYHIVRPDQVRLFDWSVVLGKLSLA